MATPNNVTPTNCSWWPISALENDAGKSTEGEENQDLTDPALKSQDRLVLYHWTQSFSSQKVKKNNLSAGFPGRNHLQSPGHPLRGEGEGLVPRAGEGSSLWPGSSFVPAVLHFNSICLGRERGGGGLSQSLLLLWDRGGSRLGFVLPHSPTLAWPGVQTKAEPGPGTTLPPGKGAAAPEPGSFQGADPGTQQRFTPGIAVAPWKSNSWSAPARNHIFQAIVNAHFAAQQPYSKPDLLVPAPNPPSFPHR